jgi:hypothetical protein
MPAEAVGLLKSALEHLKPSARTVAAFAMAYALLMLLPESLGMRTEIFDILGSYMVGVHAAGLFSITYLATFPVSSAWELGQSYRMRGRSKAYLKTLSPREKAILNLFITDNRRSATLNLTNGDVAMLEIQGILVRLTSISKVGMHFDMSIQPWAFEYLAKNSFLLEGAVTDDDENY